MKKIYYAIVCLLTPIFGCNSNSNSKLSNIADTIIVDTFYYSPEYASLDGTNKVNADNILLQNEDLMRDYYLDLVDAQMFILGKVSEGEQVSYIAFDNETGKWFTINAERLEYIKNNLPSKKYKALCDILKSKICN